MALYSVAAGNAVLAADVNQFTNLLTGVTTNAGTTLGFVGANSERLITGNVALSLSRGAVSSSSTGLMLTSTSGGTINQGFMLAPGSEDLIFGYDTGGAFNEQLRIKASQSQGLWQTSATAAVPSTGGFGGGLRHSFYGSPATDAAAFGFGIATSELWTNVPTGGLFRWRCNGTEVARIDPATGLKLYDSSGTLKLVFDTTNDNTSPGSPWFRTDGSVLAINPKPNNHLYLMYDGQTTAATTYIGTNSLATLNVGLGIGNFVCGPASVSTLAASGASSIQALTTSGTVTHNSVGRLVFSGATVFNPGGGTFGTTAANISLGITVNGTNYWLNLYT